MVPFAALTKSIPLSLFQPALLKLYNEKIAPLLTDAAAIDGRELNNVGFVDPDAVGLPKMN